MGNFFGMMKDQAVVHPWSREAQGWVKIPAAPTCSGVRIKVRMTTAQLKELMAAVDLSKGVGSSELGRLIMRELSKGRYQARVVACGDLMVNMPQRKSAHLTSVTEEEDHLPDVMFRPYPLDS